MSTQSRICIVGGGLVGTLAAMSLVKTYRHLQRDIIIDIFEHQPQPCDSFLSLQTSDDGTRVKSHQYLGQYDARNIVLSSVTAAFFQSLGLWQEIEKTVVPIEKLDISRQGGRGRSIICAEDEGVAALGYVADMTYLAAQLTLIASQQPEITYYFDAKVTKLRPLRSGYEVTVYHQHCSMQKTYNLVIAADGQNSWVCQHLGLQAVGRHYAQQALVATVSMDRPMPNIAFERFVRGGALTLLPLTQPGFDNRMSLVWIDVPEKLQALEALSEAAFLQALARHMPLEAVFSAKGRSNIYPLQYQLRRERARPHLVAIGNAAQSLHPIAAQGFNLAVRDIRDLVQLIHQYPEYNVFSGSMMQQFTQQRWVDVDRVRAFVDLLTRVFFTRKPLPFLGVLQDIALLGFELLPDAKAELSRFAMGGVSNAT